MHKADPTCNVTLSSIAGLLYEYPDLQLNPCPALPSGLDALSLAT